MSGQVRPGEVYRATIFEVAKNCEGWDKREGKERVRKRTSQSVFVRSSPDAGVFLLCTTRALWPICSCRVRAMKEPTAMVMIAAVVQHRQGCSSSILGRKCCNLATRVE